MKNYQELIERILHYGDSRMDRTGVGTQALFGTTLSYPLQKGFPATTTKKLAFKMVAGELAGFLCGTQSAQHMEELGAPIWNANALDWFNREGTCSSHPKDLGRIYGVQWRAWYNGIDNIDQLRDVVDRIKTNPSDRRLIVTAWNPGELHEMCLPPCHTHFQFFVRKGELDCIFYMRSVDTFLGMPFDIASYALLVHIICNEVDLKPGVLTGMFADTHIYNNHKSQCEELLNRDPVRLPQLVLSEEATIDNFHPDMCDLINYNPHPTIKAEMAV